MIALWTLLVTIVAYTARAQHVKVLTEAFATIDHTICDPTKFSILINTRPEGNVIFTGLKVKHERQENFLQVEIKEDGINPTENAYPGRLSIKERNQSDILEMTLNDLTESDQGQYEIVLIPSGPRYWPKNFVYLRKYSDYEYEPRVYFDNQRLYEGSDNSVHTDGSVILTLFTGRRINAMTTLSVLNHNKTCDDVPICQWQMPNFLSLDIETRVDYVVQYLDNQCMNKTGSIDLRIIVDDLVQAYDKFKVLCITLLLLLIVVIILLISSIMYIWKIRKKKRRREKTDLRKTEEKKGSPLLDKTPNGSDGSAAIDPASDETPEKTTEEVKDMWKGKDRSTKRLPSAGTCYGTVESKRDEQPGSLSVKRKLFQDRHGNTSIDSAGGTHGNDNDDTV